MGEKNTQDKSVNSLFNLVFFTGSEERTEYFQNLFSGISDKFPCRIIFIQECKDPVPEKEFVKKTQSSGAGEKFLIQAGQDQLKQVPFILLPLLTPDLPIQLIWGQNPSLDQLILPNLQQFASRLVYDSECDNNLQNFAKGILNKVSDLECDFMDIDWALISGWRDVLYQVFDNLAQFEILRECRSVNIKYNVSETKSVRRKATQAIYLQGWLAAQLGWKFKSLQVEKDIYRMQYSHAEDEVTVTLNPSEKQNLLPGSIVEVNFATKNDKSISISLDEKQSKVLVYFSTPERCELPFSLPLPNMQRGLSFMKEVFYHRADQHYLNMLKLISEISWNGKPGG